MKQKLTWQGRKDDENIWFPANVPGTIQQDYAAFYNWRDVNYADNFAQYKQLEDSTWYYRSEFSVNTSTTDKVFFVSEGIDYLYDILLNDEIICSHEGMFTKTETDITDILKPEKNEITVIIHPHPKRNGAPEGREQADNCCKPPVCYGWDWHPRLLVSGIWNDAYIDIRPKDYIKNCEVSYTLSCDKANITFETDDSCEIEFYSPDGGLLYKGADKNITINNPLLWYCNGQGNPNLYSYRVFNSVDEKHGKIGFRNAELVMSDPKAWTEPEGFPKSRSVPPTQIRLNGKNIFAKGSNFVTPEIFMGNASRDTYEPLVRLAKEANMNIFRVWGGSGIGKEVFYELCDEYGIMVWQEFPLACNNYQNDPHYLKILEQEARAIVKMLRKHPCLVLWCGGNELFNGWSRMTDQSHALRLLNKICYDLDQNTPFIATSPLTGMAHGGYLFYSDVENAEVYEMFNSARNTAYSEFGIPSVADVEYLKTFIPKGDLFPTASSPSWTGHHAFGAWRESSWMCLDVLEKYFGTMTTLEDIVFYSQWLQCEGYKAIFEEARRQKPYCSMAVNWCYNEPWKTAANNSVLSYPAKPKKAYYSIKNSLSPIIPSARISKFSYSGGELFSAELWLLNDSFECAEDTISAYIEIGSNVYHIIDWQTPKSGKNENLRGHILQFTLPETEEAESFTLKLISKKYGENSYTLKYSPKKQIVRKNTMNV